MSRVLLLGATGLVGRFCLDLLVDDPSCTKLVLLGRRMPDARNPKLDMRVAEIENWQEALTDLECEAVICALGTTMRSAGSREAFRRVDLDAPLFVARAAKAQGCSHFLVVSSIGADATSGNFYLRVKGELEAALVEVDFDSLTIVRPSLLLGPRSETRPLEAVGRVMASALAPLMAGPLRRYRPVRARAVAETIVTSLRNPPRGVEVIEPENIGASNPSV